MKHQKLLLAMMAAYRKWRDAQKAYAAALESGDEEAIIGAEEQLQIAYREYKPGRHYPKALMKDG